MATTAVCVCITVVLFFIVYLLHRHDSKQAKEEQEWKEACNSHNLNKILSEARENE